MKGRSGGESEGVRLKRRAKTGRRGKKGMQVEERSRVSVGVLG